MITTQTVFILGAGASVPYEFPSGDKLVKDICSMRQEEIDLLHLVSGEGKQIVVEFLNSLKKSQITVDTFLGQRQSLEKIGKTAIAMNVLKYEYEDHLYKTNNDDHWYQFLLERMHASFDEFGDNKVGFITFNYDRSLEQFLFNALKHGHGASDETVAIMLARIPIIHVHGQLGSLAWQTKESELVRDYDPTLEIDAIRIAADGIRVISENIDDTPQFREALQLLENSERIIFLGFQYHPENMRRLKIPHERGKKMIGTCYDFTEEQAGVLSDHKYQGLTLGKVNQKSRELLRRNPQFI